MLLLGLFDHVDHKHAVRTWLTLGKDFLELRFFLAAVISVLGLMLFLSGCSTDPVNAQSTGIWDHYIVWNFIRAIEALSNIFGHNYGWGIVIFTIIIRIVI
mgnify:CR=1 FL=1